MGVFVILTKSFTIDLNMKKESIYITFLSILLFFIITGGNLLNPNNIEWLILGKDQISDNESYLIGWFFFREAPFFQYPFLLMPKLGEGALVTLAYTDSIPLMAIFFKIFKNFIFFDFQYFGMWICLCFLLQGYFSYLILRKFITNNINIILATTLFLIAPVFLFRFQLGHFALLGQWIILASIFLYCEKDFSIKKWVVSIITSLLIHPYIFIMVLGLFAADLFQKIINKNKNLKFLVINVLISIPIIIFSLFIFGHISTGNVNNLELFGGYGHFKMNLLSIIDPEYDLLGNQTSWSKILPNQNNQHWSDTFADYEGFNFLGSGIFILTLLVLAKGASLNLSRLIKENKYFFIPLVLISIFFSIFAISNNVTFGKEIIFQYNLNPEILPYANVFRASGRFFWPVYYLIYFLIIIIFIRKYTSKQVTIILFLVICFQLYDSSEAIMNIHNTLNKKNVPNEEKWSSKLKDDFWITASKRYKRINYVFPYTQPHHSFELLYYAAKNNLSTNFGYWFKDTQAFYKNEKNKLSREIEENNYDKFSIYYINDKEIWEIIQKNKKPRDLVKVIDGYNILAPNYYPES